MSIFDNLKSAIEERFRSFDCAADIQIIDVLLPSEALLNIPISEEDASMLAYYEAVADAYAAEQEEAK